MDLPTRGARGEEPLERFKPTTGVLVGWSGLVLAALAIGYVAVNEHTLPGLRIALGAAFGAVLVWVTQIRPRVTAYADGLLMHGSLRDTRVPYLAIDDVVMGQTLNVWAGRRRFVCVGIGKPIGFEMRQRVRSMGNNSLLGGNRAYEFTGRSEEADRREKGVPYGSFVLTRITDLTAHARADARAAGEQPAPEVHQTYALPELTAVVLTGVAFVVSLLLH